MIRVSRIKYFKLPAVPAIKFGPEAGNPLRRQEPPVFMRTSRTLASAQAYHGAGNRLPPRDIRG